MVTIRAERDNKGSRIHIRFTYDRQAVALIRNIPGRPYVKTPAKHWTVPRSRKT